MSLGPLYQTLERGDPDRFLALMASPPAARERLLPLYAFNLEIARAPWVTTEPLIAEMRLQWWREALEEIGSGGILRAHEVVVPLAHVMRESGIPATLLDAVVAARRWDIGRESFAGIDALIAHLDATGGNLMWAAALALGAPEGAEPAVRDLARAGALAAWFRAVPALNAAGRRPLPETDLSALALLAHEGLGWLAAARFARASVPGRILPALLPAWQAEPVLRLASRRPDRIAAGRLQLSEFSRRGRLLWQSLGGRW